MIKWLELTAAINDEKIMINFNLVTNFYARHGAHHRIVGTRIDFNDEEHINVKESYEDIKVRLYATAST